MTLTARLLAWYEQEKRELPWRRDSDPYKIWVSEIMLQQTRVDTVIPYFEKFLERFPTVATLAAADEAEVLTYWQGLGYYNRVRNLHKGVKEVAACYGGTVPDSLAEIKKLSGVGDYTAGAILSIAYDAACPAVDGNVLRVFSRLYCLQADITTTQAKKTITQIVTGLLPDSRSGDFNQAIMDLGATLCLPSNPHCLDCPLMTECQAYQQNRVDEFPVKRPDKPPRPIKLAVGFLQHEATFLIRRRPERGLLAGMWEFPSLEEVSDDKTSAAQELSLLFQDIGLDVQVGTAEWQLTHTFSHLKWLMTVYRCTMTGSRPDVPLPWLWVERTAFKQFTWAGPHGKIADWE